MFFLELSCETSHCQIVAFNSVFKLSFISFAELTEKWLQVFNSCFYSLDLASGKLKLCYPFSSTELRKALQKQEEENKQCEKNIDDLQEKNESLKNDLTKAEKERKELSHKVSLFMYVTLCTRGINRWVGGYRVDVEEVCR